MHHRTTRLTLVALGVLGCNSDASVPSDDLRIAELQLNVEELATEVTALRTTVTTLQASVTTLETGTAALRSMVTDVVDTIGEQATRLPRVLGRIAFSCETPSSCVEENISVAGALSHPGGGLRFEVPNTSDKSVLVFGRVNLQMTGSAIHGNGLCTYVVTRTIGGITYSVLSSVVYSVQANETLQVPLTFAGSYIDGSAPGSGPNLIEVQVATVGGLAVCSFSPYMTAEFTVLAIDGLPAL